MTQQLCLVCYLPQLNNTFLQEFKKIFCRQIYLYFILVILYFALYFEKVCSIKYEKSSNFIYYFYHLILM